MDDSTPKPFAIGDRVTFTKVRQYSANSFGFSSVEGVIEKFTVPTGNCAVVKYGRSTRAKVHLSKLRHVGCRSTLTEAVVGKETPAA